MKGRLAVSGNRISDAVSSRVLAKTSTIKTIKPQRKKLLKILKDRKILLNQQNKYYKNNHITKLQIQCSLHQNISNIPHRNV